MGRLHTVPVISIVDDDESVRTATASLVRSLGFTAYTFASAEEFLRSTHVEETSCLIADVKMPGTNGIELQSLVHAQGRRTPIIFITAFPEERIRVRAMQAGAIGFLSKPFEAETLIKYLNVAISK
jgi:FixJ family two-component response regulator